jgi:hypothetical protein
MRGADVPVEDHVPAGETCEEQVLRLETARAYLTDFLSCPSDHATDTRADLAAYIDAHTAAAREGVGQSA